MSIRIQELNPTADPRRTHEVPAVRNLIDVRLRIEQILGLIEAADLAGLVAADAVEFHPNTASPLSSTDVAAALEEIAGDYLRINALSADIQAGLAAVDKIAFRSVMGVGIERILSGHSLTGLTSYDLEGLDPYDEVTLHIATASGQTQPILARLGVDDVYYSGGSDYAGALAGVAGASYNAIYLVGTAAQFRIQATFSQMKNANAYTRCTGFAFNNSTAGGAAYAYERAFPSSENCIRLFRGDNSAFPSPTTLSVWGKRRVGA